MAPLAVSNGAMFISALKSITARLLITGLVCAAPLLSPAQPVTSPTIASLIVQRANAEAEKATPYIMDYKVLDYPGGDVPAGTGVCTDLVIL